MKLIALPFQKPAHTHLSDQAIKGHRGVQDLPVAYHNLLNLTTNGGYTTPSIVVTKRPTHDSQNGLYVPYIAGLLPSAPEQRWQVPSLYAQEAFPFHDAVSQDEIIFYNDHDRALTLDYRGRRGEPSVTYHEYSSGSHFTVARDFREFLALFEERYRKLPYPSLDSYHRANAAFLNVSSRRGLERLFRYYYDRHLPDSDAWLSTWARHFQSDPAYADIADAALDKLAN